MCKEASRFAKPKLHVHVCMLPGGLGQELKCPRLNDCVASYDMGRIRDGLPYSMPCADLRQEARLWMQATAHLTSE